VSYVSPSGITLAFQMPRAEDAELIASSGHVLAGELGKYVR
jgi:hypothetical protein